MSGAAQADPKSVVERFVQAINGHDLEAIVSCFAPDYHDVEPVHPARQIAGGRTEVRKRWGRVLDGLPDFRTEVERVAVEGDTAWIEHDWSGTRADGTRLHPRGVNLSTCGTRPGATRHGGCATVGRGQQTASAWSSQALWDRRVSGRSEVTVARWPGRAAGRARPSGLSSSSEDATPIARPTIGWR